MREARYTKPAENQEQRRMRIDKKRVFCVRAVYYYVFFLQLVAECMCAGTASEEGKKRHVFVRGKERVCMCVY